MLSILLLLSMIESRHAWPLTRNTKQQQQIAFQKHLFSANSGFNNEDNNIVVVIPKPEVGDNKFHTVSCFQDILDGEDEEEDEDNDMLFLVDDEGFYYDDEQHNVSGITYHGFLEFFVMIKDTVSSIWEYNWSSNWESLIEFKDEKDEKFQLYFDV